MISRVWAREGKGLQGSHWCPWQELCQKSGELCVWKGSQVRRVNRRFKCEGGKQDKWHLEAGFGLRKGGYFLSWGKLEHVKCWLKRKINEERFKIQERENLIKRLIHSKWEFMILQFSLTLKTLVALNFYGDLNCLHKLLYLIRNLLLDIIL